MKNIIITKAENICELANNLMRADHVDIKLFKNPKFRKEILLILKEEQEIRNMLNENIDFCEEDMEYITGCLCNAEDIISDLRDDLMAKYNKTAKNSYYSAEENYELAIKVNTYIFKALGINIIGA